MKLKKWMACALAVSLLTGAFGMHAAANAKGDVNGDGSVTAEDARLCLRQAVGLESFTAGDAAYAACDATGDGGVTAEDARLILRAAVGLETLDDGAPAETQRSEYEIWRSGTFYCLGSMYDGTTTSPMEIAVTADSVYMATNMDGIDLAILQKNGKLYMINPAEKIYLELDRSMQRLMGLDAGELVSLDSLGFADMKPLSEADTAAKGELNGTPCDIYTFLDGDGSRSVVYMDGDRMLAFEVVDNSGFRTVTYFTSIKADVPADKCNTPAGYRKVGMLRFMTALGISSL